MEITAKIIALYILKTILLTLFAAADFPNEIPQTTFEKPQSLEFLNGRW